MMLTTGTLLGALAVIAVALEATGPAIVFGGIAAWMITHSSHKFPTGPLWFTGPLFVRAGGRNFKIEG
jgi:hypothetical protein